MSHSNEPGEIKMDHINRLKEIRIEKGLSQSQLSKLTGISPCYISNMESGKQWPYPGWTKKLAAILNVAEDVLFPQAELKKEYIVKKTYELPLSLKVEDIAEILGIGRVSAYNLVHRKDFPKIKAGRRIIIPTQAFLEWMNSINK